jgi:sulfur-carrier protein
MAVRFFIPGPLRAFCGGLHHVEINASPTTVRDAIESLCAVYPGLRDRLLNEEGEIREHINVFVGDEDIRYTGELATPVAHGTAISIFPSVSGG